MKGVFITKRAKGMTYLAVIMVVGVIMALILLAAAARGFTGKGSVTEIMTEQMTDIRGDGCGSDVECNGNGVCASAKCVCFDDSQCLSSCDKSIGKCG